jgi:hypothetical protein
MERRHPSLIATLLNLKPQPQPGPQSKAPWGGYLLFGRAVADGPATLARVPSASATPSCMGVKLWPVTVQRKGSNGQSVKETRVVALNKSPSGSCRVVLRLEPEGNAGFGAASLQWLLPGGGDAGAVAGLEAGAGCGGGKCAAAVGEGLYSTKGDVTLGGQSMDAEGNLQPAAPRSYAVAGKRAGASSATEFAFTLPGASGALLVVPEGGQSGANAGGRAQQG